METVLAIAFAMGRTLVLPPNEGMYLIDKENTNTNSTNKKPQQRKFSYNHFFHMESISAEHHGFDIITMKEFLDLCVAGKVVVGNNTTKQHTRIASPPNMRTDWDGAPQNEMKQLRMWLREVSDENLLHWDPDHCLGKSMVYMYMYMYMYVYIYYEMKCDTIFYSWFVIFPKLFHRNKNTSVDKTII